MRRRRQRSQVQVGNIVRFEYDQMRAYPPVYVEKTWEMAEWPPDATPVVHITREGGNARAGVQTRSSTREVYRRDLR